MRVLIAKLGATGDVVRTTSLLNRLNADVTWLTARKNAVLVEGLRENLRCISWEQRSEASDRKYELVINLEDTLEVAAFITTLQFKQVFGAYHDSNEHLCYTDDSRGWFDLSLISRFGRQEADHLKLANRHTYQELIFKGLGFAFRGEPYLLPAPIPTGLWGDVAIAADSGPVWPMKKWAYFGELKLKLESMGLIVNVLQPRSSLLEHLADVRNHRCLVGGDSLPMHFALGSGVRCVSIFACTSPWEIHGYGIQTKIVSPLLPEFFYQRGFDERATTAIGVEEVLSAVASQLEAAKPVSQIAAR
jgi:ADP-heptose:LPS heptosyltransferase